jgi:hypothetical protein
MNRTALHIDHSEKSSRTHRPDAMVSSTETGRVHRHVSRLPWLTGSLILRQTERASSISDLTIQ